MIDKKYWNTKDLETKKRMTSVYEEKLKILCYNRKYGGQLDENIDKSQKLSTR